MIMAIGTCTHSTAIKVLLVVSRKLDQVVALDAHFPVPLRSYFESRRLPPANPSPAKPRLAQPRHTSAVGPHDEERRHAVILTIAAPAEAAATMVCCALHHGGKALLQLRTGRAATQHCDRVKLAAATRQRSANQAIGDFEMVFPAPWSENSERTANYP